MPPQTDDGPRGDPRQQRLEKLTAELRATVRELRRRTEEAEAAQEAAERAERRARFLAQASAVLAGSFDYEATLRSVARLAVPRIADWCVVDVVDEAGSVARLEVAHRDPERLRTAQELQRRFPPDPALDASVFRVIRTGEPELFREVTEEQLAGAIADPEQLRMLRELGLRSAMLVPLRARGHTLGAVSLVSAGSDRLYGPADLEFAIQLAHRAATAIDNARLYDTARAASQAKSDFLAVISHELRTPLNAVMGYADLLDAGIAGSLSEEQRRQVGKIRSSSHHLLQLIEEILAYARIEAGREELRTEPTDLRRLAADAAAIIEPLAADRGLRFELRCEATPGTVVTDARKLRQILVNLLANAVKFTSEGAVDLSLHYDGRRARFRVRDTGIGIPADQLERIFEPFEQLERPETRRVGGTGLGLSVARRNARLLGGDITVESRPGVGSTFTVEVPAPPAAAEP